MFLYIFIGEILSDLTNVAGVRLQTWGKSLPWNMHLLIKKELESDVTAHSLYESAHELHIISWNTKIIMI